MQYKNPEILYALFLLLIPILIHLFQLRKFKTEAFTNVAFLKHLKLKTRKSSQLKKWLILSARLLFLTALIIAFAQPYFSNNSKLNTKKDIVIYLDNSYSLQAKGPSGELLKNSIQDLITALPQEEEITLFTNNSVYRNTSIGAIKNELLKLQYTANQLPYVSVLLKAKSFFSSAKDSRKHFICISDFQNNNKLFNDSESDFILDLIQLKPEKTANVFVDSLYITETSATSKTLKLKLSSNLKADNALPVSLLNNGKLVTKSSVNLKENSTTEFTIPNDHNFKGELTFNDNSLSFDNHYFFSLAEKQLINVLEIKNINSNPFLKRIFTDDEFIFTSLELQQLDYSLISSQHTIILNEISTISPSLINSLKAFKNDGGTLVIIPNTEADINQYNNLFATLNAGSLGRLNTNAKNITQINYAHPIYAKNVFEKQVKNFQYPTTKNNFDGTNLKLNEVLSFENESIFLGERNNTYVFTSSLLTDNSNFTQQNLVVPTFYNIALLSLPAQKLNYTINDKHLINLNTAPKNDAVAELKMDDIRFIPLQKQLSKSIEITTNELPNAAGNYSVLYENNTISTLSFNYNKNESNLDYHDLSRFENVTNSITTAIDNLQSDYNIKTLWKWFVIFALIFIAIEMLLIKFLK
jgi:hypothetical protein